MTFSIRYAQRLDTSNLLILWKHLQKTADSSTITLSYMSRYGIGLCLVHSLSTKSAIMAENMRKRNEGKLTSWGFVSSNGKLPSSVFPQLIHQVLFVTSGSGSSSTWTQYVKLLPPASLPLCWDTAVSFVSRGVFYLFFCC